MYSIEEAAVRYLKHNKEYDNILRGIMLKYKKLGRLSGVLKLKNLSEKEGLILAPLNYKFYSEREGSLSIKKFVEYFSKGKFENVNFEEVLKRYFKDDLITNKEIKYIQEKNKEEYFKNILDDFYGSKAYDWLSAVLHEKKYGYNIIIKKYKEDKEELKRLLKYIKDGIDSLSFSSKDIVLIALFSSKITKDSHYFDVDNVNGKLLIYSICYFLNEEYPKNREETNEILYKVGITRDEVSNNTITFGLRAYIGEKEHLGFKSFLELKEPLCVSIKNLNNIDKVKAKDNVAFVFENPTVLLQVMYKTLKLEPSLICTSGQLNISSLMLLDKLVQSGTTLYYSGDFDPEGLQIADKLKKRYKDKLILWRYSIDDYLSIKGNVSIKSRESKLNKITSDELFKVRDMIKREGKAGYQELLVDKYVEDINTVILSIHKV